MDSEHITKNDTTRIYIFFFFRKRCWSFTMKTSFYLSFIIKAHIYYADIKEYSIGNILCYDHFAYYKKNFTKEKKNKLNIIIRSNIEILCIICRLSDFPIVLHILMIIHSYCLSVEISYYNCALKYIYTQL